MPIQSSSYFETGPYIRVNLKMYSMCSSQIRLNSEHLAFGERKSLKFNLLVFRSTRLSPLPPRSPHSRAVKLIGANTNAFNRSHRLTRAAAACLDWKCVVHNSPHQPWGREKSKKTQIQNPKLCTFENGPTKTAFKVPYKVSLVGNFSALCVTVVLN